MAGLKMDTLMGPAAVGIASAAANVIEKQAKDRNGDQSRGQILKQASLFGDLAIGGIAVLNEAADWGFPVLGKGPASLAFRRCWCSPHNQASR